MSDQLIYAMSTRTELRLEQFYNIFTKVYLPGEERDESGINIDMRRQVIRFLDALGYCEFDFEKRMVYLCSPSLVILPHFGTYRAVFTGARTPSGVAKLRAVVRSRKGEASFSYLPQGNPNINIPAAILVDAVDKNILESIAKEAGIQCDASQPASWKLANLSSSIEDVENILRFETRQEPNWHRKVFEKDRLLFNKYGDKKDEGMELTEYINPIDKQRRHWLWKGDMAAEIERDWGRFFALSKGNRDVLLFDEKLCKLAVPVTVPLPCLLARALAMCAGILPRFSQTSEPVAAIPAGHPLQVYLNVAPEIASLVSEKIGQRLVPVSLTDMKSRGGDD